MKKEYINILILLLIFLISIYIIRFLKIMGFCFVIISILSPLFFGYIISWIVKPLIDKFKYNRVVVTTLIYILFIGVIFMISFNLIPLIINELKKIIPILKYYIIHNSTLYTIYENLNLKKLLFTSFEKMNHSINNIFNVVMNIVYSFIFGFYFLIKKDNDYFKFIPKKLRKGISKDLRLYIKSVLLDTLFIFLLFSIMFIIIGLPSPLIFALFCAVTNIFPYIGPYIGGVPAVIIACTERINLGIIVIILIIVVQIIENYIIQPLIVSKNVNLNPIYILVGIIIFSHFCGIFGMIISTPIILVSRNVLKYYKKNKPRWFNLILDKL